MILEYELGNLFFTEYFNEYIQLRRILKYRKQLIWIDTIRKDYAYTGQREKKYYFLYVWFGREKGGKGKGENEFWTGAMVRGVWVERCKSIDGVWTIKYMSRGERRLMINYNFSGNLTEQFLQRCKGTQSYTSAHKNRKQKWKIVSSSLNEEDFLEAHWAREAHDRVRRLASRDLFEQSTKEATISLKTLKALKFRKKSRVKKAWK